MGSDGQGVLAQFHPFAFDVALTIRSSLPLSSPLMTTDLPMCAAGAVAGAVGGPGAAPVPVQRGRRTPRRREASHRRPFAVRGPLSGAILWTSGGCLARRAGRSAPTARPGIFSPSSAPRLCVALRPSARRRGAGGRSHHPSRTSRRGPRGSFTPLTRHALGEG